MKKIVSQLNGNTVLLLILGAIITLFQSMLMKRLDAVEQMQVDHGVMRLQIQQLNESVPRLESRVRIIEDKEARRP